MNNKKIGSCLNKFFVFSSKLFVKIIIPDIITARIKDRWIIEIKSGIINPEIFVSTVKT